MALNVFGDLNFPGASLVKDQVLLSHTLLMKSKVAHDSENKEDNLMSYGRESKQLSDRVGLMASIRYLNVMSPTYFRYSRHIKTIESFSPDDEDEEVGGDWARVVINGRIKKIYRLH